MKRNVFGIAPGVAQKVKHPFRARVVERVDNDQRITMSVRVSREPGSDSVARALIIRLIRKIMLVCQIMIEKDCRVLSLPEPLDRLPDIARHVALLRR